MRDRISRERFQRFSSHASNLVADSAFMLRSDHSAAEVKAISQWAQGRRAEGELVIGFNVHPMLIKGATGAQIQRLVDSAVGALRGLCRQRRVALLFLSHDYRDGYGDDVCLEPISAALRAELGTRLMYPRQMFSAAQLKALAGCADGVVAGRMHLAVAAMGMERPVAALTYQDKFQGLFAHFDYPARFLLPAEGAMDPGQFLAWLEAFVEELGFLQGKVREGLPAVLLASARNLDAVLRIPLDDSIQ